jgi:hypothetical protein
VAPDGPSPLKTVLYPAFFNAASCKAGFWSLFETRALHRVKKREDLPQLVHSVV